MCMLSVVTAYGRDTWPVYPLEPPKVVTTFTEPVIIERPVERVPTQEEWDQFLEICEKARQWDELTGQPDCIDPEKDEWMQEVERRLEELESKRQPSFPEWGTAQSNDLFNRRGLS